MIILINDQEKAVWATTFSQARLLFTYDLTLALSLKGTRQSVAERAEQEADKAILELRQRQKEYIQEQVSKEGKSIKCQTTKGGS